MASTAAEPRPLHGASLAITAVALALPGNEISDFPLCNKSFNLSYAGHDL